MSMKQELVQWDSAAKAFDAGDLDLALDLFQSIATSSKIHFNIGMVLQAFGAHNEAIIAFGNAVECDNFMAVGYLQKGMSHYILGDMESALDCFHDAFVYLRGNYLINYTQLGMEYKLYSCEVLYNRALVYFQLGDSQTAMADLNEAANAKQIPEHVQIDEAIQYRGDACQIFQVPANLIFKPPADKVKNAAKKDYLGNSKVIAAVRASDNFTDFNNLNLTIKRLESIPSGLPALDLSLPTELVKARSDNIPIISNDPLNHIRSRTRTGGSRVKDIDEQMNIDREVGSSRDENISVRRNNTVGRTGRNDPPLVATSRFNTLPSRGSSEMLARADALIRADTLSRRGQRFDDKEREYQNERVREQDWERDNNNRDSTTVVNEPRERDIKDDYISTYSSRSGTISAGKLRVKVHFGEKRMILLPSDVTFGELLYKIREKFNIHQPIKIQFRDEDNELVLMADDDDLEVARSISTNFSKLELFCS